MPQWLKTLFSRSTSAPRHQHGDYDSEWSEFNLPAGSDLQVLAAMRAAQNQQPQKPASPSRNDGRHVA